mmetsp:Transcript_792/g.1526  ORF Transcript_792/g.1526 Transcript_792/m.1526 type:complete len:94 (-) Transcript_792:585-866(-)
MHKRTLELRSKYILRTSGVNILPQSTYTNSLRFWKKIKIRSKKPTQLLLPAASGVVRGLQAQKIHLTSNLKDNHFRTNVLKEDVLGGGPSFCF